MKSKLLESRSVILYRFSALLTAVLMIFTMLAVISAPAKAAETPSFDGTSAERAAASCWEIKQVEPTLPSGVYWLRTSALVAPEKFYCDQTSDGGGWVLIGRGREGWKENYQGIGTTSDVSNDVSGPNAFVPRQLSSIVVDGLLNGQRPDTLSDGIRLNRATNTAGTTWQSVKYKLTKQPRWVWTFRSETPVGSVSFDNSQGNSGQTSNFGNDQNLRRVYMETAASQNWLIGFAFGSNARGSTEPGSYIWTASGNAGNPKPFTQMFIKPRLLQSDLNDVSIPDSGVSGKTQTALAETGAIPTTWGVSGLANGNSSEMSTEVQAFTQSENTVFVGGNFKFVQQTKSGSGQIEQSYLAGFNVSTGSWISEFRPTFNGQVKALVTLPNGLVVAGGEFTIVNGTPHAGVVVLNPSDGSVNTSVSLDVRNALSGGIIQVRSLKVHDDWLYLGGNFTHIGGGTHPATTVYSRGAARVSIEDGTPDGNWNPAFNGTVNEVEPSNDGTRLYAAGYFTTSNSVTTHKIAALQTTPGAQKVSPDWTMVSSGNADFQFTVSESDSLIWHGGSEHDLFAYTSDNFSRVATHIGKYNGDFQTSVINKGNIYAGCHCNDFVYTGASFWPNLGSNWTVADKLGFVGSWNAETGTINPEFNPILDTRGGHGAWASFIDSTDTLWIGGDFTNSVSRTRASQWSGGFVRFGARDTTAPPKPNAVEVVSTGVEDTISWQASAESSVQYQVLREDRVIGSTSALSFKVATLPEARYFVRTVDGAGNYSASSPVSVATEIEVPPAVLIENGTTWSYRFENTAPQTTWNENGFDDSSWSSGSAPLGWGSASNMTTLLSDGTKPLSVQYRKTFTIEDAANVASLQITTRANDGIVVYVNGIEAGRTNMPNGTISWNSYATAAPTSANAEEVTYTIPGSVVVEGKNTVTAQVNSNYRTTKDSSFDLKLVAVAGAQPEVPVEPVTARELVAENATWQYRFDNSAPDEQWFASTYDASSWPAGTAPLGWGHSSIITQLTAIGTKPVAIQYRHTFTLEDLSDFESVELTTRADDGIILYVNGEEITRKNLPEGAVSYSTYATSAPSTSFAIANPVKLVLPASAFVEGTNNISAEVHLNYRSTANSSFDLIALALPPEATP